MNFADPSVRYILEFLLLILGILGMVGFLEIRTSRLLRQMGVMIMMINDMSANLKSLREKYYLQPRARKPRKPQSEIEVSK